MAGKESSEAAFDRLLFSLTTNLFFGAEPIVHRRTWSIATQPVEFLGALADSFFAGKRISRPFCLSMSWHRGIASGDHGSTG